MATPPTFADPPVTTNPQTGEAEMQGRDALAWAVDTLSVGGDIRSKLIRLQAWIDALDKPAPPED